jgi:8-oxo-dGTP pyrophosphatase MutT (NUDIX family)
MSELVPARPAATVVLLRDVGEGFEVLLLRRNHRIAFHGGDWVFPGGRVELADAAGGEPASLEAARRAAVRETAEEAGVRITEDDLVAIAHWTTPINDRGQFPKRFATWFFAARVTSFEVEIDRSEITAHRFLAPRAALEAQAKGDLGLPPPTYVTLVGLAAAASSEAYLEAARCCAPPRYLPRYRDVEGGACSLFPGDAAYDGLDLDAAGPRHRLWVLGSEYRLERTS